MAERATEFLGTLRLMAQPVVSWVSERMSGTRFVRIRTHGRQQSVGRDASVF